MSLSELPTALGPGVSMNFKLYVGLACAVLFAFPVSASATVTEQPAATSVLPPGTHLVQTYHQQTNADGSITAVASAAVVLDSAAGTRMKPLQPAASTTSCDEDGGILVQICTTLNYLYFTGSPCPSGFRCATLTSTNNGYYRLDTAASSFMAKWVEGAAGPCERGCTGVISGTHDFGWQSVGYGQVVTNTGYWNGKYTLLDYRDLGYQRGGTATLDYYFRARSYSFQLTTRLPD